MNTNTLASFLLIGQFIFLTSCSTSMSPAQVNSTLPTLTKSKFLTQSEAEEAVKTDRCRYLVKDRTYVAPMGFSTKKELKNGAVGIDEWVELDGGNAYVLINYKWVTVDENRSNQLHLEFDTMVCE